MSLYRKMVKKKLFFLMTAILAISILLVTGLPVLAVGTQSDPPYFYVAINPAGQLEVIDSPDDLRPNQELAVLVTKDHIDNLKLRLTALEDEVAGLADAIGGRIVVLEAEVAAIAGALADLETDLAELGSTVADLEADVTALESAVAGLEARVSALETRVDALEADVEAVVTRVDDLEAENANMQADIAALQADVATMQDMLAVVFPPPTANITSHSDGDVLSGKVTFEGVAYSPYIDKWILQWVGVRVVSISSGSANAGEPNSPVVFVADYDIDDRLDWENWLEPGEWTVQLLVYDEIRRITVDEVTVTIEASG